MIHFKLVFKLFIKLDYRLSSTGCRLYYLFILISTHTYMHLIVYVCVNFFVFSPFFVEHILKRALDTVKFFWVFLIRLTEDVISGLKSLCKDSLDISKVLCFEKTLLSIQQNKVKLAFRQLYFIPLLA